MSGSELIRLVGCGLFWAMVTANTLAQGPGELLQKSQRVLFLGDSITASGIYVADIQAWLYTKKGPHPELINCGLASETVSGLSEDGHAGGAFPRPDLAERLDRVLKLAKPDLVFACYGINCGIYEPFDEVRLAKYQQGLTSLKNAVEASGAKIVFITPPFYDDLRSPRPFSYNAVLDRYSEWLVAQRQKGWHVIDLHQAMTEEVQSRRKSDLQFTFQPDGVHPNAAGHWFMAQQIIRGLGDQSVVEYETPEAMLAAAGGSPDLMKLVQQRVNILGTSYLGTAGHKRPGTAKGLPVEEAEAKAAELDAEIRKQMKPR